MKTHFGMRQSLWVAFAVCCSMAMARAQLEIIPSVTPEGVFPGAGRNLPVTIRNSVKYSFEGDVVVRLYETSSSIAVLRAQKPWKKLRVLPGQTVVESTRLDFPAVNARTGFLVQWLQSTNVIGAAKISVYPANLLRTLLSLAGITNFGALDPDDCLKPLLKAEGIDFVDLGELELEHYSGKLVILGPFRSKSDMPEGLMKRMETIARENVAVVWILPSRAKTEELEPSFYSVQKSRTAIVVVQPELVADLADNPQSQLNLVLFCRQALNPQPPKLPVLSP